MNYTQLVVSKSPSVYVPYDSGNNFQTIGADFYNYTGGSNPTYPYTAKKHGIRGKAVTGSAVQDYRSYAANISGMNALASNKVYYWHYEFFIYLTGTSISAAGLYIWLYSNGSGTGTYSTVATGGGITAVPYQINFGTNNTGQSESHAMLSTSTLPTGQWVHVALQYDYGVKRIYINGILDSEVTTTFLDGVPPIVSEPLTRSRVTTYIDQLAIWQGYTTTRPENFPTAADILQRATFPITKTKWWDATTSQWLQSGDEQFWNGTAWVSMQDMPYKVWNGTGWATV